MGHRYLYVVLRHVDRWIAHHLNPAEIQRHGLLVAHAAGLPAIAAVRCHKTLAEPAQDAATKGREPLASRVDRVIRVDMNWSTPNPRGPVEGRIPMHIARLPPSSSRTLPEPLFWTEVSYSSPTPYFLLKIVREPAGDTVFPIFSSGLRCTEFNEMTTRCIAVESGYHASSNEDLVDGGLMPISPSSRPKGGHSPDKIPDSRREVD